MTNELQNKIQAMFPGKIIGTVTRTFDNHFMVDIGLATAYFTVIENKIVNLQFD
jgi:hypothetical protein